MDRFRNKELAETDTLKPANVIKQHDRKTGQYLQRELFMDSNDKRLSMAHFVQATQKRTQERLMAREIFPLPETGDIIIYNEILKWYDKHECRPRRGIGIVKGIYGSIIAIKEMRPNGCFFDTSVIISDMKVGLYQYVVLNVLPETYPMYMELDIFHLPGELARLVKYQAMGRDCFPSGKCL